MLNFNTINYLCAVLLIGLVCCDYVFHLPLFLYAILALSWLIMTSIGSFYIQWNYHLQAFNYSGDTTKKQIAITFDDGPNSEFTPQVLQLLNSYNAKATFFCVGERMKSQPEVLKSLIDQGHTVGNHTNSHSSFFGFFGKHKVISELLAANTTAEKIINKKLKLYRPAFGVTNPSIAKAVKQTQHQVIGWNIRSLDTVIKSPDKILDRIKNQIQPGAIILLHDTSAKTVGVLEQLLLFLQEQNYEMVSVDTLLNIEAYA